jgi:hypothetical protein
VQAKSAGSDAAAGPRLAPAPDPAPSRLNESAMDSVISVLSMPFCRVSEPAMASRGRGGRQSLNEKARLRGEPGESQTWLGLALKLLNILINGVKLHQFR